MRQQEGTSTHFDARQRMATNGSEWKGRKVTRATWFHRSPLLVGLTHYLQFVPSFRRDSPLLAAAKAAMRAFKLEAVRAR